MQVKAGVKDAFRRAPDREMVKARVKVQVKAIQKCLLNCTPDPFSDILSHLPPDELAADHDGRLDGVRVHCLRRMAQPHAIQ